jgi:hypothetical protein
MVSPKSVAGDKRSSLFAQSVNCEKKVYNIDNWVSSFYRCRPYMTSCEGLGCVGRGRAGSGWVGGGFRVFIGYELKR